MNIWGTRKEKYERARISGKVAVEDEGFMNVVMYVRGHVLHCAVLLQISQKKKEK